jgi:hypothetical protein
MPAPRSPHMIREMIEMKGDHNFRRKPEGSTNGGYARPRVQIGFDKAIIEAVTVRAKSNDRSFAAEIRDLVSLALSSQQRERT